MYQDLTGTPLRGGEYVLKEVIARGGQASVYRAYAHALETDVAVKVLHPAYASNLSFRERFHDEARRLAQLHHPNLLEVHWYGEEGALIYIVMRLVNGGTLSSRVQALGGVLSMIETGRLISQIANALQHAHDRDVLHLDVKPANVLLGRADWPLVADLGLTQAIARQTSQSQTPETRVAGTPAYMSPEQCRGEPLDGRSDEYSLAVTAYELLTGRRPFSATTTDGLMQAQMHAPPPRPSSVAPGLPSPVEDVLLRGLAKDREDRFATTAEFGGALAEAIDRTRGVALETKRAAAGAAPNLLAMLALVLAAPFLLAMLPVGTVFGRLPLAWPFQLLLAGVAAILLLGIRWHLIGLLGRAADNLRSPTLRKRARASAEGAVNLVYLVALYRLLGGPLLGVLSALVSPEVYRLVAAALLAVVGIAALLIVVRLFRAAGPLAALLVLTLGWTLAALLPTGDIDIASGSTLATVAQLAVASALLVLLLSQRAAIARAVGDFATAKLGRLIVEGRPGTSPEHASASRAQIAALSGVLLDVVYLLVGYASLRGPLLAILAPLSSSLAAAIVASAVAIAVWLVLIARLRWIAGLPGIALGLVLGAPILLTLPLLDVSVLQAAWPATVASWLVGGGMLLLIALLRGPTEALAQAALGARLDRGLLGTTTAATEDQSARRVSALGRVTTAFMDVAFLLIIYWILGVPLTNALVQATGRPELGSLVLAAFAVLALLTVLSAARRAAANLADSGAITRARATGLVALAAACAALLVSFGVATPAALAGPSPVSATAFAADQASLPEVVVVNWDAWLPFSPRSDQATYALALACSNGQPIGAFREAFTPPAGASMPTGSVGPLGATSVPCAQWQQVYTAHRRAAGLSDTPSYAWDWHDVQATVAGDRTVSVVETFRVLFSAGQQSSLTWDLGVPQGTSVQGLQVSQTNAGGGSGSQAAGQAASGTPLSAQVRDGRTVMWTFPTVSGPAERTFVVRYRYGAVGSATGTLFEQTVAGAERLEPVWNTTVEVQLPSGVDAGSVALSADGARGGVRDARTAVFAAQDVAGGASVDVRVGLPTQQPTQQPPATLTTTPTLTLTLTPTGVPTAAALVVAGATSVPPTATFVPPTATREPPTATPEPPAPTRGPPTATPAPEPRAATATAEPPAATLTPEPPTATPEPPTATPSPEPPTATATPEPPTATPAPEPPTATPRPAPPTATPEPPTATPTHEPPTATATPEPPTATPTPEPPTPTATATPVPVVVAPPPPGQGDTRMGIAEGFRDPATMADTHANWERIVLSWADIQPQSPSDFSRLGQTITNAQVQGELSRGVKLTGLLQFTPAWAQANPDQGQRSPPKNLNLPYDDPNNYWGQFVYQTVKFYSGRVDEWVIWNEPEFRPTDAGSGGSFTWQGTDAEFAQLLKVAYLAAKKANPNAVVSFPGTSYWTDQNAGRPQFYDRVMQILAADPDAARLGFYHDRVSLNLYRTADDLMRVFDIYKGIQAKYHVDKPIWLTESNSMPTDDQKLGACAHSGDPIKTTLQEQASYAVQAFAMAAASGYERIGFYKMVDGNACSEPAVWGVVRDDGSRRPVEDSLRTAMSNFLGSSAAQFVPLPRVTQNWSPWPDDPTSYTPNWQVYQVAVDKPGGQRISVLWSGDGQDPAAAAAAKPSDPQPPGGLLVQIPAHGSAARAIDKFGQPYPYFSTRDGNWVVYLKPATATFSGDPAGYHFIGGDPVLIVEDGVNPGSAVDPPQLLTSTGTTTSGAGSTSEPGGGVDFQIAVNPADGQTIQQGDSADFTIATQGLNGFNAPISLRISKWSTQRFPQPKPPDSLPLGVTLPDSVPPGRTATVHIETSPQNDVGIYFLTVEASGGGVTHTVDLALVVDPPDQ